MVASILDTVKDTLDVELSDTAFDSVILTHVNSIFPDLLQIGIGPSEGFAIMNNTETWEDYLGPSSMYASVQSYMYMRVRYLWDPPQTAHHMAAMDKAIEKAEFRLKIQKEEELWKAQQSVVVVTLP